MADLVSEGTWFLGFFLITEWVFRRQWACLFELDTNTLKYILFLLTFFLLSCCIIAYYNKFGPKNWVNWSNVVWPLINFPSRKSDLTLWIYWIDDQQIIKFRSVFYNRVIVSYAHFPKEYWDWAPVRQRSLILLMGPSLLALQHH